MERFGTATEVLDVMRQEGESILANVETLSLGEGRSIAATTIVETGIANRVNETAIGQDVAVLVTDTTTERTDAADRRLEAMNVTGVIDLVNETEIGVDEVDRVIEMMSDIAKIANERRSIAEMTKTDDTAEMKTDIIAVKRTGIEATNAIATRVVDAAESRRYRHIQ